jgi:hypothetical protein
LRCVSKQDALSRVAYFTAYQNIQLKYNKIELDKLR